MVQMKSIKLVLSVFIAVVVMSTAGVNVSSAVPYDGSSAEDAAFSAKQILQYGYAVGDGNYWLDYDGAGMGASAAQVYADMSVSGGGWTLLYDSHVAVSSSFDYYSQFGATAADLFIGAGTSQANEFYASFGVGERFFLTPADMTGYTTIGSFMTYFDHFLSTYRSVDEAQIFVREGTTYSALPQVDAPVPEPSTILLLSSGLIGLVGWNRRKKSKK